jgi:transposase
MHNTQVYIALIQKGFREKSQKMTEQTSQEKVVSRKGLILLGIMGVIGLILLAFGVFSIFEISVLLGLISLVLGFVVYFIFILIERKLKLL